MLGHSKKNLSLPQHYHRKGKAKLKGLRMPVREVPIVLKSATKMAPGLYLYLYGGYDWNQRRLRGKERYPTNPAQKINLPGHHKVRTL